MANSVDPDETPHSVASHLGLYCLLRPVCPKTYGKYGMANSADPDQTPRSAESDLVSTLIAKDYLSQYLGLLRYLILW